MKGYDGFVAVIDNSYGVFVGAVSAGATVAIIQALGWARSGRPQVL